MPSINPERLLNDLKTLRAFGASGNGVIRTALSKIDLESRSWLAQRFADAGLDARLDAVGNVFGLSFNPGPAVLIGSHSDTQPQGGWLDGAYGVISALEVARAVAEDPATKNFGIDIVSWMDEEGTFFGCLGSMAFCETLDPEVLRTATDADGRRLADVLAQAGLDRQPPVTAQPERQVAYLEAHIEQGPVLDDSDDRIGVVTAIVGVREYDIHFVGEQNHAGTTPMGRRKDAAQAMIALAADINQRFPEVASDVSVWTIGSLSLGTDSSCIVPGEATLRLQLRDPDEDVMERLEALLLAIVAAHDGSHGVRIECQPGERLRPAQMNESVQDCLSSAAERHAPGRWRSMPSGAIHDAQILAGRLPSGMLFVPSIGGVSHSFAEDTDEDDLVLGCQVLCDAAINIIKEHMR